LATDRAPIDVQPSPTRRSSDLVWSRNSPEWDFTEADLDRAAVTYDNPDYVDIVLHSYRHRLLAAPGDPAYDDVEARLLELPPVPDRKSTRLNSSHVKTSYAVFC